MEMTSSGRTPLLCMGTTAYAEVVLDAHADNPQYEFTGFLENLDPAKCTGRILGLPVFWSDTSGKYIATHAVICALGTTHRRGWIEQLLQRGFRQATLVHGAATVSRTVELEPGCIVDPGVVIAAYTRLDTSVRIGRLCSIGHHSRIGAFTTVHPASTISGNCRIGSQVVIGTGATIIDGIEIGDGAFVAAGSVVTRNIAPRALVSGNPARQVKENFGPR